MYDPSAWFDALDRHIASFMRTWGTLALRFSVGVVFIWFGLLKPLAARGGTL